MARHTQVVKQGVEDHRGIHAERTVFQPLVPPFLVEVGMLQLVLEQTAWNDRLDPEYPLCAYIRYQTQPKKKRKFES